MLEKVLNRADVKEFLHEVLYDERFINKTSPELPENGTYPKTEYSLILIMDALMKYQILFDTDDLIDEYILQLRRFMKKCENHRDLAEGINRVLGRITAVILNIDLEKIEEVENKKKILSYIYNRYITNGYVFHSFPGNYEAWVKEKGLDPLDYSINMASLKDVKKILESHNGKNILKKDLKDTAYFTITDSFALAYHYAFHSPYYLAQLSALTPYMENEKKYDRGAYYRKEFNHVKENIEELCRDLQLSNKEATVVLETVIEEWRRLDITNGKPTIALIKRSSVDHNYLKDYRKILDICEKEELSFSIEKIFESRIAGEKRYTPISPVDIKIAILPTYKEIYNNDGDFVEEKLENIEEITEKLPERINIRNEVVNTYGNASIVALAGVLLIALGATITILLTIYKG